jgi:hypothetical protein
MSIRPVGSYSHRLCCVSEALAIAFVLGLAASDRSLPKPLRKRLQGPLCTCQPVLNRPSYNYRSPLRPIRLHELFNRQTLSHPLHLRHQIGMTTPDLLKHTPTDKGDQLRELSPFQRKMAGKGIGGTFALK